MKKKSCTIYLRELEEGEFFPVLLPGVGTRSISLGIHLTFIRETGKCYKKIYVYLKNNSTRISLRSNNNDIYVISFHFNQTMTSFFKRLSIWIWNRVALICLSIFVHEKKNSTCSEALFLKKNWYLHIYVS